MPTRGELKSVPGGSVCNKQELENLSLALPEDEQVLLIAKGWSMSFGRGRDAHHVFAVCTDRRIRFFRRRSFITKLIGETEIPLHAIRSISHRTGILPASRSITIVMTDGASYTIYNLDREKIPGFVDTLNTAREKAAAEEKTTTPPTDASSAGLVDQMEKLAKLHDDGILTDEEFEKAKQRLLTD